MALLTCALGPDNAGSMLLAALSRAERVIDASVYEVGRAYEWALMDAAARGVVVRLVVDPRSDPQMRSRAIALAHEGVECRLLARPDSFAHAKMLVVDDATLALGSGNLNGRDAVFHRDHDGTLAGTREWWLSVDGAPTLAKVARSHVMRNWRAAAPAIGIADMSLLDTPPPIRPVNPEVPPLQLELTPRRMRLAGGGAGVRTLQEELLGGVRKRALLTVPYVTVAAPAVAALIGALVAHARRGVDVRVLLGEPPRSASDIAMLLNTALDIRLMDSAANPESTTGHAKGLICDNVVVVGSANWSEPGLTSNDEAALAIDHADAANYYAAAFERDWETAREIGAKP